MRMNRVDGAGVGRTGQSGAIRPEEQKPAQTAARKPGQPATDSVDLSDEARQLLQQQSAQGQDRVEAARLKLANGELDTPQAAARAAEKLLRSGDLDGQDAG